jgi:hypothetical protein
MILDAAALWKLLAQHAAEHGVPVPTSHGVIQTFVAEAERLADGRTGDEPAALFYVCARNARTFGNVSTAFLDDVAAAQAAASGLKLDASLLDIMLLRGRIAFDAAGWEDVRNDFAGWLHRPGGKPPRAPPKRPR